MPYLSASAVVIHYEEVLYQVYAPLPSKLAMVPNEHWQKHISEQLAQGCTRQHGGWKSDPRLVDRKSSTLPLCLRATQWLAFNSPHQHTCHFRDVFQSITIVSEMTYTVSSGTLNSSIPYQSITCTGCDNQTQCNQEKIWKTEKTQRTNLAVVLLSASLSVVATQHLCSYSRHLLMVPLFQLNL